MRTLYLLRHAQPDFPGGVRRCLGCRSDPPLGPEGRRAAGALSRCFAGALRLFASPLLRCRETAALLSAGRWETEPEDGLLELDTGDWDGLRFAEIREGWPELYGARQFDLSIPPPGGETYEAAAVRGLAALGRIMEKSPGDAVAVAHAGINRAVLCTLLGRPMREIADLPQPYGCVNVLGYEDGRFTVWAAGADPLAVPEPEERASLLEEWNTPEPVRAHCAAVRETALELAEGLAGIDTAMLSASAELHDLCRTEPDHARAGAEALSRRGYLRLARIAACHHDCPTDGPMDEEKLLFLADKLVRGDRRVTLEERFAASEKKCGTPEALAALERRKHAAASILARLEEEKK